MANKNKTATEEILIEVVLGQRSKDEVMASLPSSLFDNATATGRTLILVPVDRYGFEYGHTTFPKICQDEGLSIEECKRVKELIDLNSGRLPVLLRKHLKRGYGSCARLCEALVEARQAITPPHDRKLYLLPPAKRSGFM